MATTGMKAAARGGASCVLTHFCEAHGPSVVFTTQIADRQTIPLSQSATDLAGTTQILGMAKGEGEGHSEVSEGCPACGSIPPGSGLLTVASDGTAFLSTHHPDAAAYRTIRTACVRSLSSELAPGRDGMAPVLFTCMHGDGNTDVMWGVLSLMYRIADSQARGFSRCYSLLVLMADISVLVQCLPWLSGYLSALATDMQVRAQKTQSASISMVGGGSDGNAALPLPLSRTSHNPGSFRRSVRATTLRSLQDILDDKTCFTQMHERFCWILGTCAVHLATRTYRVLHLVPDPPATITEGYTDNSKARTPMTLATLRKSLGAEGLRVVVYNVLVGNQLIVRGDYETAGPLFGLVHSLLPAPCAFPPIQDTRYRDAWEAPFLSLPLGTEIPHWLETGTYAIIDIHNVSSKWGWKGQAVATTLGRAIERLADDDHMMISNTTNRNSNVNGIGDSNGIGALSLGLLVEEWIAKAKSYAVLRPIVESPRDKRMVAFAKAMGITCDADWNVLAFWTTGIKPTRVLNEIM
jgi:folliculin